MREGAKVGEIVLPDLRLEVWFNASSRPETIDFYSVALNGNVTRLFPIEARHINLLRMIAGKTAGDIISDVGILYRKHVVSERSKAVSTPELNSPTAAVTVATSEI